MSSQQNAPEGEQGLEGIILSERYEVLRKLGAGNMGEVYQVRDRQAQSGDRTVSAIKVLPKANAKGDTARRFRQEVDISSSLDHPSIVAPEKLLFDTKHGISYAVMEYKTPVIEFVNASEGKQRKHPSSMVWAVAQSLFKALQYIHRKKIIHRDIKPSNIMVAGDEDGDFEILTADGQPYNQHRTDDYIIKPRDPTRRDEDGHPIWEGTPSRIVLLDLGIAKKQGEGDLTATGQMVGSPLFMSPEQARGLDLDGRSDIFSLGSTLYFLAEGQAPFPGTEVIPIVQKIFNDPTPIVNTTDEELRRIIFGMMQKHPDDRLYDELPYLLGITDKKPTDLDHKLAHFDELIAKRLNSRQAKTLVGSSMDDPTTTTKPIYKPRKRALWPYAATALLAVGAALAWVQSTRNYNKLRKQIDGIESQISQRDFSSARETRKRISMFTNDSMFLFGYANSEEEKLLDKVDKKLGQHQLSQNAIARAHQELESTYTALTTSIDRGTYEITKANELIAMLAVRRKEFETHKDNVSSQDHDTTFQFFEGMQTKAQAALVTIQAHDKAVIGFGGLLKRITKLEGEHVSIVSNPDAYTNPEAGQQRVETLLKNLGEGLHINPLWIDKGWVDKQKSEELESRIKKAMMSGGKLREHIQLYGNILTSQKDIKAKLVAWEKDVNEKGDYAADFSNREKLTERLSVLHDELGGLETAIPGHAHTTASATLVSLTSQAEKIRTSIFNKALADYEPANKLVEAAQEKIKGLTDITQQGAREILTVALGNITEARKGTTKIRIVGFDTQELDQKLKVFDGDHKTLQAQVNRYWSKRELVDKALSTKGAAFGEIEMKASHSLARIHFERYFTNTPSFNQNEFTLAQRYAKAAREQGAALVIALTQTSELQKPSSIVSYIEGIQGKGDQVKKIYASSIATFETAISQFKAESTKQNLEAAATALSPIEKGLRLSTKPLQRAIKYYKPDEATIEQAIILLNGHLGEAKGRPFITEVNPDRKTSAKAAYIGEGYAQQKAEDMVASLVTRLTQTTAEKSK